MTGLFITVEGGEGSGKTTVLRFIYEELTHLGYDVILTREPGGIEISEQIRDVILSSHNNAMEERTEALLYAAARRQHLVEKVIPALKSGKIVLCDRFIDSSLTYQGHARRIGMEDILMINEFAIGNCMPSLTLFFDVEPEIGLNRIVDNNREQNRLDLESLHFHKRVYEGYHLLLNKYPGRIKRIDASKCIKDVRQDAYKLIFSHIKHYQEGAYK